MKILLISVWVLATANALSLSKERAADLQSIFVRGTVVSDPIPYQLSLQLRGNHFCGASLISVRDTQAALVASHCIKPLGAIGIPLQLLTLVAGAVDLSDRTDIEQTRFITHIVQYDKPLNSNISSDIAILFLNEPFIVNEYVSPASLPKAGQETKGKLLLSGWNWIASLDVSEVKKVRTLEADMLDREMCQTFHKSKGKAILRNQFCSGWLGDLGGAAFSLEGKYLAGILSDYDIVDSDSDKMNPVELPGVYVEISYFVDWIDEQVANHLESTDDVATEFSKTKVQ